jgi:hypothetical protein
MVSVPVRGDWDVLAAMLNATVPSPLPFAPDVMVNQAALLVPFHAQPAVAVTVTFPDPADAPGFSEVGATV